jgi:uncharacterized protein
MKSVLKIVPAACLAIALALAASPATAQQAAPDAPTPGAIAAAKEILRLKNASAMYAGAVPGMVEKVKATLIGQNLNYQKDLNEVAPVVAKQLAGREQEIGDGMVGVYAGEFTEQELKDLVTFYKSPLGQKLLATEPRAIQLSMSYMNQWAIMFAGVVNEGFREEMKKRNKPI